MERREYVYAGEPLPKIDVLEHKEFLLNFQKAMLSSLVKRKTLMISRFAANDLPEPGVPKNSPFGFLRFLRFAIIRLFESAFSP